MQTGTNQIDRPLISIIVPVFNAEPYLADCLDSLTHQTYSNIEIICVNDGSLDQSLDILRSYAQQDARITIIDKKNAGVSQARNDALSLITGDYVMFADADDWLDLDTCETVIQYKDKADIILWDYAREYPNGSRPKGIFTSDCVLAGTEIQRKLVGPVGPELSKPEAMFALCPVWGKMYPAGLLKGIHFVDLSEIGSFEDGLFNIAVFSGADTAYYINKPLYHYRKLNNTSITSRFNPKLFEQWQFLFQLLEKYGYQEALNNRIALSLLGLGLNILSSKESPKEKVRMINEIIYTTRFRDAYDILDFSYFPLHWKVFYYAAKQGYGRVVYLLLRAIAILIS